MMKRCSRFNVKRIGGFSIAEVLVTIIIVVMGFLVLVSVLGASLRMSVQSRNRAYAHLVAENMIEKIQAHTYGEPEPAFWTMTEISKVVIEGGGAPLETAFIKQISYQNGSFIGDKNRGKAGATGDENFDIVTVTISWQEGTKAQGQGRTLSLTMQTEVRRNAP